MKMKQILGGITAASVPAAGLVLGGAGAASAGSQNLYTKSCTGSSSVSTQAFGQNQITFNAVIPNVGVRTAAKGSNNDSTARWQYAHWWNVIGSRVEYVSSGSVANAGTLSNAAWFCDV